MSWQMKRIGPSTPMNLTGLEMRLDDRVLLGRSGITRQPLQHLCWSKLAVGGNYRITSHRRILLLYAVCNYQLLQGKFTLYILYSVQFLPSKEFYVKKRFTRPGYDGYRDGYNTPEWDKVIAFDEKDEFLESMK